MDFAQPDTPHPARRSGTGLGRLWRHLWFALPGYGLTLWGRPPRQLAATPADPWLGHAESGRALILDDSPLERGGPELFHRFAWLRDLHGVGGDPARRRGRTLTSQWLDHYGHWNAAAWRADLLAERIVNWIVLYEFFWAAAHDGDRARLLASLARQVRHLRRAWPTSPPGEPRIRVLKGLIAGQVCVLDDPAGARDTLAQLDRELGRQILPDGGHVSRSPGLHLEVLRHLVDIRALLAAGNVDISQGLLIAIDRMAPMLRFFRHGDGRLALFHGSREGESWMIDMVLTLGDARGRPPASAPHTGYERLTAGRACVLVDTGAPPPPGHDMVAHAAPLAFEMSVGKQRLIVNCGALPVADSQWLEAQRATAAHATLILDDTNAAELVDVAQGGGFGRRPREVTCDRHEESGRAWLEASHDGYRATHGVIHHRRLFLEIGGSDLRGEDRLSPVDPDQPWPEDGLATVIRFHLHPDVQASLLSGGDTALLRLPGNGGGWHLQADAATLEVTDSIYLGRDSTARRTSQVVLTARLTAERPAIRWAIRKI